MKKNILVLFIALMGQIAYGQADSLTKKNTCTLDIASILTKNDGEKLHTSCPCEVKSFHLDMFDRWGNRVYSTTVFAPYLDINIEEKIKVGGKEKPKYPSGTYFWRASYQALSNGAWVEKKMTGKTEIMAN